MNDDVKAKLSLKSILRPDSQERVKLIIKDIAQLPKLDRLFLFMELPSSNADVNTTDRTKIISNPLGTRSEIKLTVSWINTHLEEDWNVSLPKHEVYDQYLSYCDLNGLKALSTADFGKVMKQVYPLVRPRRLGARGSSKYCYAGLKKRTKLAQPLTPDPSFERSSSQFLDYNENDPISLFINEDDGHSRRSEYDDSLICSDLVREWARTILGTSFLNLMDLATYLVQQRLVNMNSVAATRFVSLFHNPKSEQIDSNGKGGIREGGTSFNQNDNSQVKMSLPTDNKRKIKVSPILDSIDALSASMNPAGSKIRKTVFCHGDSSSNQQRNENYMSSTTSLSEASHILLNSTETEVWKTREDPLKLELSFESYSKSGWQDIADEEIKQYFPDDDQFKSSKFDKLSQVRQLLEKNLQASPTASSALNGVAYRSLCHQSDEATVAQPSSISLSEWDAMTSSVSSNTQRKVSFQSFMVQSQATTTTTGTVSSLSPGPRKRNFSFQPISPRQGSLPASPFISPRSTPINVFRSRHGSGTCLSGGSDISRTAIFGSASEGSTPFISPIGTPIPFNRSRHNSAQGKLCRSRHSSGINPGPSTFRYGNLVPHSSNAALPYSPMALNNLNNPCSPQATNLVEPSQTTTVMFPQINQLISCEQGDSFNDECYHSISSRQRHTSDGIIISSYSQDLNPASVLSPLVNIDGAAGLTPRNSSGNSNVSQNAEGEISCERAVSLFKSDFDSIVRESNIPDDLDIALSALQDCDNDFSNFVHDTSCTMK